METARVDITYRPLRIGFALISSDLVSFRKVVRLCSAFWGGLYNPIIAADMPESAKLVEVFRPDFLVPIGDDPAIAAFIARFPHLINPLFPQQLFFAPSHGREGQARLLDMQNLIVHHQDSAEWKALVNAGFRFPRWALDDPLADAFLAQFGGFPNPTEIGLDYDKFVSQATTAIDIDVKPNAILPPIILDHPSIAYLNRHGLEPHYNSNASWIYHGLYLGDASNSADLINFWNLRACGMQLHFLDLTHRDRLAEFQSLFIERLRARLSGLDEFHRKPAIWSRDEFGEQAKELAGQDGYILCSLGEGSWNGLNIHPQIMHFGKESSLGVLGGSPAHTRIRFALKDKPFSGETRFYQQHLVASVSLIGGRTDGANYTFQPPYIPELNEFAARAMHYDYSALRLERDGVGVVIDAADHDISLEALSSSSLIEQIFDLGGFLAKPSSSGLITRQLITRMGGLDGARAFKIPGVRKLLKTYDPNQSFTRNGALQLIGQTDEETNARFADHQNLYIEPRDHGTKLTKQMVFSHLVEKGLFRMGANLKCPSCALASWTALDALRQQMVCPLCGNAFDATRQLVDGQCAYRRSGILGHEKNAMGAVPVALLLQQLSVNLGSFGGSIFGTSYDLTPKNGAEGLPKCETDFCVLTKTTHSDKTSVIIGECKDVGKKIDKNDIDNLKQVADALPDSRFDVFVLLAKLAPFTPDEILLAQSLNSEPYQRRVIMLTQRELEPYHLFEKTNIELGLDLDGQTAENLVNATHEIYFAGSTTTASGEALVSDEPIKS
jgi:hypothetical protein